MISADLGPCSCIGYTCGVAISTSWPENAETPLAQRYMSESAVDSQNRSSAIRSMTGSLSTPPSWLVRKTYAQRPGSIVVMSRGVSSCMNASASGPAISTHFCTPTSHSDARSSTFQYSLTGES